METDDFDYEKAKADAEKMLKVIEGNESPAYVKHIKSLVPAFYSLAISTTAINICLNGLKDSGLIEDKTKDLNS